MKVASEKDKTIFFEKQKTGFGNILSLGTPVGLEENKILFGIFCNMRNEKKKKISGRNVSFDDEQRVFAPFSEDFHNKVEVYCSA